MGSYRMNRCSPTHKEMGAFDGSRGQHMEILRSMARPGTFPRLWALPDGWNVTACSRTSWSWKGGAASLGRLVYHTQLTLS